MTGKILVVDDEELVLKTVQRLLRKEGYEVITARNGREAIQHAKEGEFDLLVTDIRMPSMNGIEIIRQIRQIRISAGKKPTPEICITGYADNDLNHQAQELGVADYLYKPFDLVEFLACVKKHLKEDGK